MQLNQYVEKQLDAKHDCLDFSTFEEYELISCGMVSNTPWFQSFNLPGRNYDCIQKVIFLTISTRKSRN